tara:strand:+ start:1341 stop:1538 length:198 start_codon:yes stop_codon:yes gene_type:complete
MSKQVTITISTEDLDLLISGNDYLRRWVTTELPVATEKLDRDRVIALNDLWRKAYDLRELLVSFQ